MALYSLGTVRVETGDVAGGRGDLEEALPLLEAALRLAETRQTLGFRGSVLLSLAGAVYLDRLVRIGLPRHPLPRLPTPPLATRVQPSGRARRVAEFRERPEAELHHS
jgi:hypothetical protein